jgi:hypothetical protein
MSATYYVVVLGVMSMACAGPGDQCDRSRSVEGRTWSLDLPDGWHMKDADQVVSVFRPAGVGALQISAFVRDESVTDEHLQELAEDDLKAGAVPESVQFGAFSGFQVSATGDGGFWSRWYVRHGRQALFMTYNCRAGERGLEYDEVKRILQTLKVVDH